MDPDGLLGLRPASCQPRSTSRTALRTPPGKAIRRNLRHRTPFFLPFLSGLLFLSGESGRQRHMAETPFAPCSCCSTAQVTCSFIGLFVGLSAEKQSRSGELNSLCGKGRTWAGLVPGRTAYGDRRGHGLQPTCLVYTCGTASERARAQDEDAIPTPPTKPPVSVVRRAEPLFWRCERKGRRVRELQWGLLWSLEP